MKPKTKMKKLQITEADFMLAQRRAARLEEIAEHGRPVSFRKAIHKSKKVYDRKHVKKAGINSDDLPSVANDLCEPWQCQNSTTVLQIVSSSRPSS